MPVTEDQILKWQKSLTSTFGFQEPVNEQMPESVAVLSDNEAKHSNQISMEGCGFRVLMLSYQDFAMHTLEEAPKHGHSINAYNYAMNWAAMRRLRCGWNVYDIGYYDDAASYLRSVLETTMYLSCVLKGFFKFQHIHELDNDIDFDTLTVDQFFKATRKHNRRLSNEIRDKVYGASSGLSDSERKDIEVFLWTHHSHVHRSESSVSREVLELINSQRTPPIPPVVDLQKASIFCNAAVLVSWTHFRVLPYLSLPSRYSRGWLEKYRVLEEAFKFYVQEWEKPMKKAFLALIETSYTFDENIVQKHILSDTTS